MISLQKEWDSLKKLKSTKPLEFEKGAQRIIHAGK